MVELIYVGLGGTAYVEPPLGQLETGQRVLVDDSVVQLLLASGAFVPSPVEEPPAAETPAAKKKSKPQED